MRMILLHGLGQTGSNWKMVRTILNHKGIRTSVPALYDLGAARPMTLESLLEGFEHYCTMLPEQEFVLCGLSLGGILALEYAKKHPEKVSGLILIGVPYTVSRNVLAFQNQVMKLMPKKYFDKMRLPKDQCLSLLDSLKTLPYTENVELVKTDTLIVCGEKDKANRKGAYALFERLPDSRVEIIPGARHEVNTSKPRKLANTILGFVHELDVL